MQLTGARDGQQDAATPYDVQVRRISSAAAILALASACTLATAGASLPLAPLSTLGKLAPAPNPGPLGPEDVPVPNAKLLLAAAKKVTLGETVDGVTCQSVEKVAYHIHVHLTIFVDGQARVIPYGIGIGPPIEGLNTTAGPFVTVGSCFMWLHTHALDGIIHVESPTEHTYTLGQFFAVWGQPLGTTQVGPAKGKVTTFYDGKVWTGNPGDIPLTSATQIQLDGGKPLVAPEHIDFPKALLPAPSSSK
jgi:hypothetical protein